MIDLARLNDLRSEIGVDDFQEVLCLFLEEADEVVEQLTERPDLQTIESRLHFLKGSALNLGLSELAVLCQNGERSAAKGKPQSVDILAVTKCYAASKQQLMACLGQSKAA